MLKNSVNLLGIKPEMCIAYTVANEVYKLYNLGCVITSCTDGKHSKNSYHYKGLALDLRCTHTTPVIARQIAAEIQEALGNSFTCLWEKDHIHLEYDAR